jgi:hypothetical protein
MVMCSWCRVDYVGPVLYHVCADGTTFAQRFGKTREELAEEYTRQDRLKISTSLVREDRVVHWTPYDIDFLREAKINPW